MEKKVKLRVCYKNKAWEETMMNHIQPQYGSIDVEDMINWSRLHKDDLENLRPMCQDVYRYEAVAIYKIPQQNYEVLSGGWFSPNHACSSIYVPFHICDTEIYDPYETGEAAALSLELLDAYGHDVLTPYFSNVEEVFLHETIYLEEIAVELIEENHDAFVSDFLTVTDVGMQQQAFLTEEIWLETGKVSNEENKQKLMDILEDIWEKNYTLSLTNIKTVLHTLNDISTSSSTVDKIEDIALNICKSRIEASKIMGRQSSTAEEEYEKGKKFIKQGEYESGFDLIEKAFTECNMLMKGQIPIELSDDETDENDNTNLLLAAVIILLIVVVIALLIRKKQG